MGLAVVALGVSACTGEITDYAGQITLEDLQDRDYTSPSDVLDALHCDSFGVGGGWDAGGDFDALAFARENSTALGVSEPVETVLQVGPDLWAVGNDDGLVLGAVSRASVVFCLWEN